MIRKSFLNLSSGAESWGRNTQQFLDKLLRRLRFRAGGLLLPEARLAWKKADSSEQVIDGDAIGFALDKVLLRKPFLKTIALGKTAQQAPSNQDDSNLAVELKAAENRDVSAGNRLRHVQAGATGNDWLDELLAPMQASKGALARAIETREASPESPARTGVSNTSTFLPPARQPHATWPANILLRQLMRRTRLRHPLLRTMAAEKDPSGPQQIKKAQIRDAARTAFKQHKFQAKSENAPIRPAIKEGASDSRQRRASKATAFGKNVDRARGEPIFNEMMLYNPWFQSSKPVAPSRLHAWMPTGRNGEVIGTDLRLNGINMKSARSQMIRGSVPFLSMQMRTSPTLSMGLALARKGFPNHNQQAITHHRARAKGDMSTLTQAKSADMLLFRKWMELEKAPTGASPGGADLKPALPISALRYARGGGTGTVRVLDQSSTRTPEPQRFSTNAQRMTAVGHGSANSANIDPPALALAKWGPARLGNITLLHKQHGFYGQAKLQGASETIASARGLKVQALHARQGAYFSPGKTFVHFSEALRDQKPGGIPASPEQSGRFRQLLKGSEAVPGANGSTAGGMPMPQSGVPSLANAPFGVRRFSRNRQAQATHQTLQLKLGNMGQMRTQPVQGKQRGSRSGAGLQTQMAGLRARANGSRRIVIAGRSSSRLRTSKVRGSRIAATFRRPAVAVPGLTQENGARGAMPASADMGQNISMRHRVVRPGDPATAHFAVPLAKVRSKLGITPDSAARQDTFQPQHEVPQAEATVEPKVEQVSTEGSGRLKNDFSKMSRRRMGALAGRLSGHIQQDVRLAREKRGMR